MSLVRFQAKNHRQQVTARGGADDAVDDRGTTPADFGKFDSWLGPFTLDVAASDRNAKCSRYFTFTQDGLRQSWAGERVWCNPPYSRIGPWIDKAWRGPGDRWCVTDGACCYRKDGHKRARWMKCVAVAATPIAGWAQPTTGLTGRATTAVLS